MQVLIPSRQASDLTSVFADMLRLRRASRRRFVKERSGSKGRAEQKKRFDDAGKGIALLELKILCIIHGGWSKKEGGWNKDGDNEEEGNKEGGGRESGGRG